MFDESTDIEADNIVKRYARRHHALENYCLADFVSKVVSVSNSKTSENQASETQCSINHSEKIEQEHDNIDDWNDMPDTDKSRYSVWANDSKIVLRSKPKIIRYVKYNKNVDPENYFREQLMLYHPWRNEDTDLLNGNDSYEESFKVNSNAIELKMSQYDGNKQLLDNVEKATDTLNLESFDDVCPNIESIEANDASCEPRPSNKYAFYRPETYEHSHYDLGADIGLSTHLANDDVEMVQNIVPENTYLESLSQLNSKQRQIHTYIISSLTFEPEKQLTLFITGGAGVGKSVVIRTLYQSLYRLLCSESGQNPEDIRILLCAYTGLAAYNIKGSTLHSAFSIEPNKKLTYKQLSDDKRNTLQTKYKNLSVLIIDEVSMVGNEMLKLLHLRLQEVKGNKDHFGGVHSGLKRGGGVGC